MVASQREIGHFGGWDNRGVVKGDGADRIQLWGDHMIRNVEITPEHSGTSTTSVILRMPPIDRITVGAEYSVFAFTEDTALREVIDIQTDTGVAIITIGPGGAVDNGGAVTLISNGTTWEAVSSRRTGIGANLAVNGTMDSTFGADAVVDGAFDTGYGFDLVTNGKFGADIASWTNNSELPGSIAWDGVGSIELTTPIAFSEEGIASQSITVVIGQTYRFTADRSGGNCLIYLGTAVLNSDYHNAGNNTNSVDVIVVPTTTTLVVTLRNYDDTATPALIDNIILREVLSTGSELVTNGTFPADITSWTDVSIGGGSSQWNATGKLELINSSGTTADQGAVYQTMGVVVGASYRLQITKSGGNSTVTVGSTSQGNEYLNGSQDLVDLDLMVVATTTLLSVKVRNYDDSTNALIDNVTVTELTAEWEQLTPGTSMAGGVCQISAASGTDYIRQTGHASTQGKVVEVSIEVTAHTSGAVRFRFDGDSILYTMPTTIGTHTMAVVNNGTTGYLYFYNSGVTDITFDNVTVKEVIETDWTKSNTVSGYGAIIHDGVCRLTSDGSDEYLIQTGHSSTLGKLCQISLVITDATAGSIIVGFEETGVYEIIPASVGLHTVWVTNNGPSGRFKINRNGVTDITFDTVSVREVDGTSLGASSIINVVQGVGVAPYFESDGTLPSDGDVLQLSGTFSGGALMIPAIYPYYGWEVHNSGVATASSFELKIYILNIFVTEGLAGASTAIPAGDLVMINTGDQQSISTRAYKRSAAKWPLSSAVVEITRDVANLNAFDVAYENGYRGEDDYMLVIKMKDMTVGSASGYAPAFSTGIISSNAGTTGSFTGIQQPTSGAPYFEITGYSPTDGDVLTISGTYSSGTWTPAFYQANAWRVHLSTGVTFKLKNDSTGAALTITQAGISNPSIPAGTLTFANAGGGRVENGWGIGCSVRIEMENSGIIGWGGKGADANGQVEVSPDSGFDCIHMYTRLSILGDSTSYISAGGGGGPNGHNIANCGGGGNGGNMTSAGAYIGVRGGTVLATLNNAAPGLEGQDGNRIYGGSGFLDGASWGGGVTKTGGLSSSVGGELINTEVGSALVANYTLENGFRYGESGAAVTVASPLDVPTESRTI